MSEKVELKPCPFCGGEATRTTMRKFKYVSCVNFDCSMVVEAKALFSREEEAIKAWNTRKGEDERIAQAVAAERAQLIEWLNFTINAAETAADIARQKDAYTSEYEAYTEAITNVLNEVVAHVKGKRT